MWLYTHILVASQRGDGVALALAEAGATVYVTDRESRTHRYSGLPGTVEDTAEQVDQRGGRGIPARVDITDDPRSRSALWAGPR
jgi:NAD(P)-dependent dehydrogenase (short-subunit alcohol dehydrogenase family)